jgi:hypothetical protein
MAASRGPQSSPEPSLPARQFLEHVRVLTLTALEGETPRPVARIVFSSLQIHFGDARMHYEVWPVRKTGRLEIGLHLEGTASWSRAVAAALAQRGDEIRRVLGPGYELEDWTAAWCRLHETLPYQRLSPALAEEAARRLVRLITRLRPIAEAPPDRARRETARASLGRPVGAAGAAAASTRAPAWRRSSPPASR